MRNAPHTARSSARWIAAPQEWQRLERGRAPMLVLCALAVFAAFFELGHQTSHTLSTEWVLPVTQSSRENQTAQDELSRVPPLAVALAGTQHHRSRADAAKAVTASRVLPSIISAPLARRPSVAVLAPTPTPLRETPATPVRSPTPTPSSSSTHGAPAAGHTTPHGSSGASEGSGSFDSSG